MFVQAMMMRLHSRGSTETTNTGKLAHIPRLKQSQPNVIHNLYFTKQELALHCLSMESEVLFRGIHVHSTSPEYVMKHKLSENFISRHLLFNIQGGGAIRNLSHVHYMGVLSIQTYQWVQ